MKKALLTLLLTPLLVACSQGNSTTEPSTTKTIVVATAGDIPPFDYEENGNLTGYDVEVLKAIDEKLPNYEVQFQKTAWESIFPGIDAGRYQAAANNLSYTKERAEKYLYSLPIAKNPLVLVSQKSQSLTSLDQIAGKTTQDDTGTSTAKLVTDWNQEHASTPATIDYSGEDVGKRLFDLANGEFDFLIFDKISVEKIIKDRGLDLAVVELESSNNPNNYIVFGSDQEDFKKEFDTALKGLYQDGTLEKLSNIYLGGSYLPDQSQLP
ncbi:amino acid ABC transporter substrate-binding protein [Streptococcus oralis]|uniref:Cysteine ABC transporter, substrate-binding protein n=2 Tax=Streptococcus oralis TaxID=1303 RepID=A0A139NYG8_STROR|nr:amino acid ABC transporter substrate-binding protein [Streptococcus oralis]KXT80937.1 Cysteine ABC transporter, substrate-binding protein [Streptococcus oralis]